MTTTTARPPTMTQSTAERAPTTKERLERKDAPEAVPADWRLLYLAGGVAAALLAVLIVAHSAVFFVAGLPTTVPEWFALFQRNALLGLLAFELLLVLFAIVSILVVLALYVALRPAEPTLMGLYLAFSLVGVVAFIVARPAFEMLSLSTGYAAATTEAQRAVFLAGGEVMLAVFQGTAFWVSYLLGSLSGLVLAAAMVRTAVFGKATAYLRLASSVLDFGLFVPGIGVVLSLGSVLCLLVFHLLVARRLLQMASVPRIA